jgi:hypothetical protein
VDDPGGRREDAQIAERLLAPAQKPVAFAVALEFPAHVDLQRIRAAGGIHLDGMVDDQVHRHERVHPGRVAAEPAHGLAHCGQVHHARHAGKILQQEAAGFEGHLRARRRPRFPRRQPLDILFGDRKPVAGAQRGFEQYADRIGQPSGVVQQIAFFERGERAHCLQSAAEVNLFARAEWIDQFIGHQAISCGGLWLAAVEPVAVNSLGAPDRESAILGSPAAKRSPVTGYIMEISKNLRPDYSR